MRWRRSTAGQSECEISVDCMSDKDGDAKHTKDYGNHFNHFDGPLLIGACKGRSWFHAGFFGAGKWFWSHSRLKFGNSQAAGSRVHTTFTLVSRLRSRFEPRRCIVHRSTWNPHPKGCRLRCTPRQRLSFWNPRQSKWPKGIRFVRQQHGDWGRTGKFLSGNQNCMWPLAGHL